MQVIETRIGVRILVVALLIAIEGLAEAKLIAIQLEELVRQSAFIAYGKTVHQYEPGGDSTVLFAPAQILKGAAGIIRSEKSLRRLCGLCGSVGALFSAHLWHQFGDSGREPSRQDPLNRRRAGIATS